MFTKALVPVFLAVLALSPSAFSVELSEPHKLSVLTSIFSVETPVSPETDFRVMSTVDGRVYKLEASNTEALAVLRMAMSTNRSVELRLVPGNAEFIDSASLLDASREDAFTLLNWEKNRANDVARENKENKLRGSEYQASVLDEKRDAQDLFDSVYSYKRGYDVDDHCYDRAMYWSRMFWVEKKVKSMKVFLFFTPKYQRDHKFKWWFHVAPFVYVGDSEREIVIDPTFESEVMTMKAWSLDFADKAKKCEDGDSMKDYRNRGEVADCILIKASMYHYLPDDLERNPSVGNWRCADLQRVAHGIPAPFKKDSWKDIKGFFPADCR